MGTGILRANGNPVVAAPLLTQLRVIVGVGLLVGAAAVFALGLGVYPLAWWAGLGVLVCHAALVLGWAAYRLRRPKPGGRWR